MRVFSMAAAVVLAGTSQLLGVHISDFSPPYGAPGDQVTITGSGFYPGTLQVWFNGARDYTAQAIAADGSVIQATVPAGAKSGPIQVTVDGSSAYSAQNFTVIGPGPYITGFTPTTGADRTTVYIDGVHFTTATSAYFNGKAGTGFFVQSDTRIQVQAPVGVISGPISVSSPQGRYTNTTLNFLVPPVISGFTATTGRAGTNVLIKGTNFLAAVAVWFNGTSASFSVQSNNAILAQVPNQATTGPIRVDGPAGSYTTSSNFYVQPVIFGFTPGFGPAGTSVTVTGANFKAGATLKFNGTVASSVSGVSFNQLTAVVPSGATTGPLSITTSDGNHTSGDVFFVPPTIAGFNPNNSAPGSRVKISGNNLTNATAVYFNDLPAPSFMVSNNTTMSAIVPLGVITGPLTVATPGGTNSSSDLFYAMPTIASFAPTHGLPGDSVTLRGSSFLGTTAVLFNGVAATILSVQNDQLVVTVPVGAQTGPITVVAPAGSVTTPDNFVLDYTSDLAVTVVDAPDPVTLGSNLVYTITLKNNGPYDAPNVLLTNVLPESVILKSTQLTAGTLTTNGTTLLVRLDTLAKSLSTTLTLNVEPKSVGLLTNAVGATSGYVDPVLANNSTNAITMVEPLPLLSIARASQDFIKVSWSVDLTNWTLQYNQTVDNKLLWASVTNVPITTSSNRFVLRTNAEAAQFYRLRKPNP